MTRHDQEPSSDDEAFSHCRANLKSSTVPKSKDEHSEGQFQDVQDLYVVKFGLRNLSERSEISLHTGRSSAVLNICRSDPNTAHKPINITPHASRIRNGGQSVESEPNRARRAHHVLGKSTAYGTSPTKRSQTNLRSFLVEPKFRVSTPHPKNA